MLKIRRPVAPTRRYLKFKHIHPGEGYNCDRDEGGSKKKDDR